VRSPKSKSEWEIRVQYEIRDEENELMRVVGRLEEAKTLVNNRAGWTYKRVKVEKPVFQFEDAPF
jgi:hypothetical protein